MRQQRGVVGSGNQAAVPCRPPPIAGGDGAEVPRKLDLHSLAGLVRFAIRNQTIVA